MLEAGKSEIKQVRSVRKEPFTDREIKHLLGEVSTVVISRGKKSTEFKATDVKPADLKGPTGNYRSPIVRKGTILLIGFNPDALEKLV